MEKKRDLARRLMLSVNKVDEIYYAIGKSIGVKENTLTLLYALDDGKPHTQKQICSEWLIPKTTINTVVRECALEGYVTLIRRDGTREKQLVLTRRGSEYARDVLSLLYEVEDRAMLKALERAKSEFVEAMELFVRAMEEEARRALGKNSAGDR